MPYQLYIDPDMSEENTKSQYGQELAALDVRLDELIILCRTLRDENALLRHQHTVLASEHASLVAKNELAQSRVGAMLVRLKSMEQDDGE